MSMISAQIDGLRERAKELRNLAPDPDVPYLVPSTKETMALAMRSAAGEMEDAADTIWQLRDDLQRTNAKFNAENAKLRDERREYQATIDSLVDECADHKAENAKLRELLRDMWDFSCVIPDEPHTSKEELDYSVEVWKRMRELGVEVNDGN